MKFNFKIKRYFLLILIVFILGNTLIVGLSIEKTLNQVSNSIYESFDTLATIQGDSYYETHQSAQTYYRDYYEYKELLKKISKEKEIEFSSIRYLLENSDLIHVVGRTTREYSGVDEYDKDLNCFRFSSKKNSLNINLIGTSTSELVDEITNHISLTDGRHFTKEEINNSLVAIIPNNLVNSEGEKIQIGDKITIQGKLLGSLDVRDTLYEQGYLNPTLDLVVVGMYRVIKIEEDVAPFEISNRIYVPNKVVEDFSNMIVESLENFINVDDLFTIESEEYFPYFLPNTIMPPYYKLKSYEDANVFKEKCEQLLNETTDIKNHYRVVITNDTIERILEPTKSIEKVANTIKNGSFIGLGFLIFVIVGYYIKNSTHEIAIYRALGQTKSKIILKFFGEIMLSVMIAFLCIRITSPYISSYISQSILENIETEGDNDNIESTIEFEQVQNQNIMKDFDAKPSNQEYVICGFYLLIISFLGCALMIFKIIKTNVKDILM